MKNFYTTYKFQGKVVPMKIWGKDHWSTLAYIDHCVVEKGGLIDNQKMRCNPRLHRELANVTPYSVIDGSKYPTILKDGKTKRKHDDWSCLEDMVAEGLVEAFQKEKNNDEFFNCVEVKVKLTKSGIEYAAQLRAFKQNGGKSWSDFEYRKVESNASTSNIHPN